MFRPLVEVRARIYDMQHDPATSGTMTWHDEASGETCAIGLKLPLTREDWERKRRAVDAVMWDIGGVVTRVGDETIGEMWSLWDGKDILNEIDPRFGDNIERHIHEAVRRDPFHVSANTDPKGDRSKRPQEQDPDMLVHVVRETDTGIVIRGAKYETAAAYAEQAFLKPTIANWGDDKLSDYAVGCIVRMNAPGVKHICRTGFAGRAPARDYPLSSRFDEVDSLVVLDDVLIPWEDVLFYRHTRAATFIRATLHRYSAFAYVQRILTYADMMIGAAVWNVKQTGLERQPAVQEKLAELAVYREGINAHLTAAVAAAQESPSGLLMPNQSLLFTGRVHACANLPAMMHLARELCGGQICITPDTGTFEHPDTAPWLAKFYTHQRALAGGGPPQAPRLRARPPQLRLRRPPADLPALRPVSPLRPPRRGLPQLRLGRAARLRPPLRRPLGSGDRRRRCAGPLTWSPSPHRILTWKRSSGR